MDDFLLTILPSILVPCDLDFYLQIDWTHLIFYHSFMFVCLEYLLLKTFGQTFQDNIADHTFQGQAEKTLPPVWNCPQ